MGIAQEMPLGCGTVGIDLHIPSFCVEELDEIKCSLFVLHHDMIFVCCVVDV